MGWQATIADGGVIRMTSPTGQVTPLKQAEARTLHRALGTCLGGDKAPAVKSASKGTRKGGKKC